MYISSRRFTTSSTLISSKFSFWMTLALSDHGFQFTRLLGPNKVTESVFTDAAIWEATESKPIKHLQPWIKAASSGSVILPARFKTLLSSVNSDFSIISLT